jgi:fatty acid desaturase
MFAHHTIGPSRGALRSSAQRGRIFAHSGWDALLVGLAAVELALTSYATVRMSAQPAIVTLALAVLCVVLNSTNYQCVAHNFIHNPFFKSARANRAFSVLNSLALKAPQSLYRAHHLDHHRYNNDRPDARTGTVHDRSSTYRYARVRGEEEHLLSYALLGPFRSELGWLWSQAVRRRGRLAHVEVAALLTYVACLTWANWRGVLLFLLPAWYLGQVSALVENYLEHHHARPGDRLRDSVSCYAALYNALWFNNGYHQEHHYRPQVHWTRVKALRQLMPPEAERRVVRYAHAFNLGQR